MSEPPSSLADPFQLCGTTIDGKYRIASVVGDGGFGVVYRGVHQGFAEPIAVKCLKLPGVLDASQREGFLEQLQDEGRLLHRLSKATPGIVQALDVGAVTTALGLWVPYLVLEWLDGETLGDHLAARVTNGLGGFPLVEAVRLLGPAARALAVAHSLKVAHRDVKPHNLFVSRVGDVKTLKVLDFGIAKVLMDHPSFTEALAATGLGPAAFTPRYGAPEQFNRQRGATGPWTDVFALALILVELLTGKKALSGDDPTQLYIASADPGVRPTPRTKGVEVPDEVERVLDRALAVDPKNRFADAGEFWDALLVAGNFGPGLPALRPSDPPRTASSPSTLDLLGRRSPASDPTTPAEARGTRGSAVAQAIPPTVTSVPESISLGVGALSLQADPSRVAASPGADRSRATGALGASVSNAAVPAQPAPFQATAASPGAVHPPPVDPMSETPFFERHYLPPSGTDLNPVLGSAPGLRAPAVPRFSPSEMPAATNPHPKRTGQGAWPYLIGIIVAGGVAIAVMLNVDTSSTGPSARSSTTASAQRLPSARPRTPPPPIPSGVTATPSAPAVPAVAPSPSAAPSASADPDAQPTGSTLDMVLLPAPSATFRPAKPTAVRPFYLDRTEVTVRAYLACVAKGACLAADRVSAPEASAGVDAAAYVAAWSPSCNAPRGAVDHPVNCIDYAAAEAFCRVVGKRLPTEAEWDYAARGSEGRTYPWGTAAPECGRSCYDKNGTCRGDASSVSTCPVGIYPADRTPEGIYDLAGDVSEWVNDATSATAGQRVVRGGSFFDMAERLRSDARTLVAATTSHPTIGFRCAMNAPSEAPKL